MTTTMKRHLLTTRHSISNERKDWYETVDGNVAVIPGEIVLSPAQAMREYILNMGGGMLRSSGYWTVTDYSNWMSYVGGLRP